MKKAQDESNFHDFFFSNLGQKNLDEKQFQFKKGLDEYFALILKKHWQKKAKEFKEVMYAS